MVGLASQILSLIVLFFFDEELDADNLTRFNGIYVDLIEEDTDEAKNENNEQIKKKVIDYE